MSFVVGGGVVFTTNDMTKIHEGLRVWRKSMIGRTKERVGRYFMRQITEMIDDAVARGDSPPANPYSIVRRQYESDRTDKHPPIDVDFSIFIAPFEGKVYGNIFSPDRLVTEAFRKTTKLVKPFPYWDNTDPPPNISYKAWDERRRIWDAVFQNQFQFTDGFVANCTPKDHIYTVLHAKEVLKYLDSLEKRAYRAAHQIVVARRMEVDGEDDRSQKASDYMVSFSGRYMRARDWIADTEDGRAMLSLEANHLMGVLGPITEKTL